jgi:hypothetical protein
VAVLPATGTEEEEEADIFNNIIKYQMSEDWMSV